MPSSETVKDILLDGAHTTPFERGGSVNLHLLPGLGGRYVLKVDRNAGYKVLEASTYLTPMGFHDLITAPSQRLNIGQPLLADWTGKAEKQFFSILPFVEGESTEKTYAKSLAQALYSYPTPGIGKAREAATEKLLEALLGIDAGDLANIAAKMRRLGIVGDFNMGNLIRNAETLTPIDARYNAPVASVHTAQDIKTGLFTFVPGRNIAPGTGPKINHESDKYQELTARIDEAIRQVSLDTIRPEGDGLHPVKTSLGKKLSLKAPAADLEAMLEEVGPILPSSSAPIAGAKTLARNQKPSR